MAWLNELSIYSVLIPLIAGAINFKNIELNSKIIFTLVLLASIPQLVTIFYSGQPTVFYNGYILVDALAWPCAFFLSSSSAVLRKVLLYLGGMNIITVILFFLLNGYLSRFYYELVCLNSMLQVIYVALYFYNLNNKDHYINLKMLPVFWYCLGLLLYATCTFFVFLFYFKINKYYDRSSLNYLLRIHYFFNILMYIFFTVVLSIKHPVNVK